MKSPNHLQLSPRKIALGALALIGLLSLVGCVVTSIYPYYTAKDVVFEPKLVGRWMETEKSSKTNEYWEFTRAGTNDAYTLTVHEGDKETEYQMHLFRLKDFTFLDGLPMERHDDFVPPHYVLKVSRLEPTLDLALLDYKWLGELLEKQPGALRHVVVDAKPGDSGDGQVVLTADTAELQKFILKHAGNTNAFTDGFSLERQK